MTHLKALLSAAICTAAFSSGVQAYSGKIYTVCKLDPNGDNYLALRTCGSSDCPMTHKLGPGTFLLTWEPYSKGRWRQVTVARNTNESSATGPSGWVYDGYICKFQH